MFLGNLYHPGPSDMVDDEDKLQKEGQDIKETENEEP